MDEIEQNLHQHVIPNHCQGDFYEIRIQDHLDVIWSEWFDSLSLDWTASGVTISSGRIPDQAALLGILNRLYRLNLTLLSVIKIDPGENPVILAAR